MPILGEGRFLYLLHKLNEVLQVAIAFLNCQVYEVSVLFLVKVGQQVRMQVHFLKEHDFLIGNVVVLEKHSLDSDLPPVKSPFEHDCASASQTKHLALIN